MRVLDLMTAPVITAAPTLSLPDAAHLMRSRGIRRLPVLDGVTLVGIVTDRDVREAMPSRVSSLSPWEATTRLAAVTVADVMRRSVLTTRPDADARDAAHTMLTHRVGALPVVDDQGRVVGVVTVSDVLRDYAHEDGLNMGCGESQTNPTERSSNGDRSSGDGRTVSAVLTVRESDDSGRRPGAASGAEAQA